MSYQPRGSNECVAACARMIFRYYGVNLRETREQVKRELGITRHIGTTTPKLLSFFKRRGFNPRLAKFRANISIPAILLVETEILWQSPADPGQHAVILTGIKNGYAYLNDPYPRLGGKLKVTLEHLRASLAQSKSAVLLQDPR